MHNQGIRLSRTKDPEHYAGVGAVEYRMLYPDIPYEPQTIDAGLGLLHRNLITMSGGYELLGVYMPHPPLTDESVYTEFFGAPVRFDTGRALLRVPTKLFAQPMSTPVDPELRRMVVEYLEAHYTDPRESVVTAVRSAVSRALGTVPARIDLVAEWLHMHPRTLQRRLAQEGTSFQAILDDVRKNAAPTADGGRHAVLPGRVAGGAGRTGCPHACGTPLVRQDADAGPPCSQVHIDCTACRAELHFCRPG